MEFYIDTQYLKDVLVEEYYERPKPKDGLSGNDFFATIKHSDRRMVSRSYVDHPEFTKLRNQLGELGYIKIEKMWCNGDRVIKPFMLNGQLFREDDKFLCAAAMGNAFKVHGCLK